MTQEIGQYRFKWGGIRYVLVDTPGFDDSGRDDEDIFLQLAKWTARSFRAGQRMNGLLYLHPIISNRERGSEMRNLRMFKKICGEKNYANVVLGLTFCDQEEEKLIADRQKQLVNTPEWWGDMIARGSRIERIPLDRQGCIEMLSRFAPVEKLTLNIQSEVVEKGLAINDTEAAQTIAHKQELEAIRTLEKRELASMRADFEQRMKLAKEDYARKMAQERQRYESIRKRQQVHAQALSLQGKLQEELERRERLLRVEEQIQEEEQANELARLHERIRQITLENDELEAERHRNAEFRTMKPLLTARARRRDIDWEILQAWKEAGHVQQVYTRRLADAIELAEGCTLDDFMRAVLGGFCDVCLMMATFDQSFCKLITAFPSETVLTFHDIACRKCKEIEDDLAEIFGHKGTVICICASCNLKEKGCYFHGRDHLEKSFVVPKELHGSHEDCLKYTDQTSSQCRQCSEFINDSFYLREYSPFLRTIGINTGNARLLHLRLLCEGS